MRTGPGESDDPPRKISPGRRRYPPTGPRAWRRSHPCGAPPRSPGREGGAVDDNRADVLARAIRPADRIDPLPPLRDRDDVDLDAVPAEEQGAQFPVCLLYTSDAAD